METITVKFEDDFVHSIERVMKRNRYFTKSEFIREAIREKVKELEKEEALSKIRKIYGSSKKKTTDEELHKIGDKAFEEIKKELNSK